jgi:hypothetical protein
VNIHNGDHDNRHIHKPVSDEPDNSKADNNMAEDNIPDKASNRDYIHKLVDRMPGNILPDRSNIPLKNKDPVQSTNHNKDHSRNHVDDNRRKHRHDDAQ